MTNQEKEIIKDLSQQLGTILSLDTSVNLDCGCVGGDAVAFIEYLQEKYNVNLEELDIWKYFEEDPDIFTWINFFKEKLFSNTPNLNTKPNLKVIHLIEVIKQGKWFDPE